MLISIIVVGFILWLILWGVDQIPMLDPYKKVVRVIIVVVGIIYLLRLLLPFVDGNLLR